jgi:formylglycine-generating enzyme required for sulfatase activity/serine/threonine protein kinase
MKPLSPGIAMSPPVSSGSVAKDPLVDTVVAGRYRVLARLGQGGMSVTYRAWDMEASRPVVLKHPKPEMLARPEFLERFSREARMMAALNNPNVVPVTMVGEHDGIPYLVMPFLPGGSLSNRRLRDESGEPQPMHPSTLQLWLPQVAAALDYVHSQGVVHRDVKPGNVFFDSFWHAYLGDFGISKIVEETESLDREHTLTATSVAVGTHGYMAPEIFTPKPVIEGRTDQYALAVMVYEMLAGRRPFTGDTAHLIVEVTTKNVPPLRGFRRDLPRSLEAAVEQALAKHSGDRFESCLEFAERVLAEVPPMQDEPDVARLLCPACENLLKLPTTAAGKKGRCPRCKNKMEVAADLSAFWLKSEEVAAKTSSSAIASLEPSSDSGSGSQSWEAMTPSSIKAIGRRLNPLSRAWAGTFPPAVWWMALAAAAVALFVAEAAFIYDWSTSNVQQEIVAVQQELRASQARVGELEAEINDLEKENVRRGDERARLIEDNKRLAAAFAAKQAAATAVPPPKITVTVAPVTQPVTQPPVKQAPHEESLTNSIGMKLRLIPAGTFTMGDADGTGNEKPPHQVTLTKPFYMGVYEVTNAQYKSVMGKIPSDQKRESSPVEQVSWQDAMEFCGKLTQLPQERVAQRVYRLPTEAEWEYACRAGTTTKYSFGDADWQLDNYGWFKGSNAVNTHPVGLKKPNRWGLYDMHGNVWEWCSDFYGYYPDGEVKDPQGLLAGSGRVLRGGSWLSSAEHCRSAYRDGMPTSRRGSYMGFRLALSLPGSNSPVSKN